MRNTAPQLVSYAESSFVATGTGTTKTLSWLRGDVIVVIHGNEGTGSALGTPTTTGSGLAFIVQQDNTASSTSAGKISTAIATADSSGTISATNPANSGGLSVWIWRGSDGIGTSAMSSTTSPVVSMTPSDTHSAICYGTFDFHVDTIGTITPTPTTVRQANSFVGHYVYYTAEIQDQPNANKIDWGVKGGTQVGPFTNLAIEILGTTSPIPKGPFKIDASLGVLNNFQSFNALIRNSSGNLYAITQDTRVHVYKSTNNGISWVLQDYRNAPRTTTGGTINVASAIDGSDIIHIAYVSPTAGTDTLYVSFNTSTDIYGRTERAIFDASGTVAEAMAITVDSNNIPHIAACSARASTSVVFYGNRLGGAWKSFSTGVSGSGTDTGNIDIQIDNNNVPIISFEDQGATNSLVVLLGNKNNPSSFTSSGIIATNTTPPGVSGTSLTIDTSGNVWVSYAINKGRITLYRHKQQDAWGTWQTGISNQTDGRNISLAADANDIYVFYERNLGGLAYDRYDTINGKWLGETIIQPRFISPDNRRPSFIPHNPTVKWSQYFNNGDTGANNTNQDTIEYLFDDGATVYYDKLVTAQISTGLAQIKFTPATGGATTTSTSSTSSSTSTSISTSSTSSSTSTSISTSTSSTSSSTSTSISTSSTSSSTSISTSSTSSSTSTSKSTSTSSTSSSTSTSISTSSTSSSISTSSTSQSTSTSSTSQSTSTSSTSSSTSTSTSISTSSTSQSTSTSISTSSTSSSISTSSTSSSTSISTSSTSSSISTSSTSQSTSTSVSTSSTSSSISTSSTSSSTSISTSSTSSSISTSSTSSSTSVSTSISTSSTSSSTSTSISTSSTSSSISTSSTSSSTSTSKSTSTSSTSSSTSTSVSTSSTSSSISTSSTSSSISTSTTSSSTSTSISTSSTSSSISTSTSISTSSTSTSISTSSTSSSTSTSQSTSTSSTSSSTSTTVSLTTSTSSTSSSTSTSISTSSTSSSTSISTSSTSQSTSTSSTSSSTSISTSSTSGSTSQSTSTSSTSTSTSRSTSTSSTSSSTSTSKSTSTSSTSTSISTSTSLSTSSTSTSTTVSLTTSTSSTSSSTSSTSSSTSTSTTLPPAPFYPRSHIKIDRWWHHSPRTKDAVGR